MAPPPLLSPATKNSHEIHATGDEIGDSSELFGISHLKSVHFTGFISSLNGNDEVESSADDDLIMMKEKLEFNSIHGMDDSIFRYKITSPISPSPKPHWLFSENRNLSFLAKPHEFPSPSATSSFVSFGISTTEPSLSPMSEVEDYINEGNLSLNTSQLPMNFKEISDLNKDCIIVYSILFFLAAVGNLLVLSCVSRHDRLGKSRTPLLIMNLCAADLITAFFLMPTEIFWRYTIAWEGGELLCKFCQFVRAFGLYLSSNVIVSISLDRYYAIVYPLKLAGAVKRVKGMLVGAWITSAIFASPQIFIYHVASHPDYPEFRQCVTTAFLKAGPYNELIYNFSSVAALYFIPLLVIIYTYTMILWKIHQKSKEHRVASQQETSGEIEENHFNHLNSSTSSKHLCLPPSDVTVFHQHGTGLAAATIANNFLRRTPSKRTRLMLRTTANQTATLARARSRTLRLTLLILLTFLFCWTPYVVMTLWYMLDRGGASQVDERLQEALFIMVVANSVINPIIYGTVGRKQDCQKRLNYLFRTSPCLRPIFRFFRCVCKKCCDAGESSNTETVIITLNRMNGSTRSARSGGDGANGINSPYSPRPSCATHDLSPLSSLPTTPRSQIVMLRGNNRSPGIVVRFASSLPNGNNTKPRVNGNNEGFENDDVPISLQYIVPEGKSSDLQLSTHV